MKTTYMKYLLSVTLALAAGGCGSMGANVHTDTTGTGINQVMEEQIAAAEDKPAEETAAAETQPASEETEAAAVSYDSVDVDLTTLSATMVYSEVYNMITTPDNYLGKTIKMNGQYTEYYNETTDRRYFACIILDATACCAQGIEFDLTENYVYPKDYPGEGDMVSVIGVYDRYEEDGFPYYTLRNAVLAES